MVSFITENGMVYTSIYHWPTNSTYHWPPNSTYYWL